MKKVLVALTALALTSLTALAIPEVNDISFTGDIDLAGQWRIKSIPVTATAAEVNRAVVDYAYARLETATVGSATATNTITPASTHLRLIAGATNEDTRLTVVTLAKPAYLGQELWLYNYSTLTNIAILTSKTVTASKLKPSGEATGYDYIILKTNVFMGVPFTSYADRTGTNYFWDLLVDLSNTVAVGVGTLR